MVEQGYLMLLESVLGARHDEVMRASGARSTVYHAPKKQL